MPGFLSKFGDGLGWIEKILESSYLCVFREAQLAPIEIHMLLQSCKKMNVSSPIVGVAIRKVVSLLGQHSLRVLLQWKKTMTRLNALPLLIHAGLTRVLRRHRGCTDASAGLAKEQHFMRPPLRAAG